MPIAKQTTKQCVRAFSIKVVHADCVIKEGPNKTTSLDPVPPDVTILLVHLPYPNMLAIAIVTYVTSVIRLNSINKMNESNTSIMSNPPTSMIKPCLECWFQGLLAIALAMSRPSMPDFS